MNTILRTTALTSLALCLSFGLSLSAANAADGNKSVRVSQARLASLGYPVGNHDGIMGPLTVAPRPKWVIARVHIGPTSRTIVWF